MTKSKPEPVLSPILIGTDDARRLSTLANSSIAVFPRVARFSRGRRNVQRWSPPIATFGKVRMGSQVRCCDHKTGDIRDVVLVYPHEADISLKRISVLTPAH